MKIFKESRDYESSATRQAWFDKVGTQYRHELIECEESDDGKKLASGESLSFVS